MDQDKLEALVLRALEKWIGSSAKEQRVICDGPTVAIREMNSLFTDGWMLVPGTLSHFEDGAGPHVMAVLEKEKDARKVA